jgi:hypothetical protein
MLRLFGLLLFFENDFLGFRFLFGLGFPLNVQVVFLELDESADCCQAVN